MDDSLKRTVKEVLLGIGFFGLVELLATVFFIGGNVTQWSRLKITVILGLILGSILAAAMFLHMRHQMEIAMDLGREGASKKLRVGYALRLVVTLGLLALALITDWMNPIALLVGMLNLKFAVYLQPVIHKRMTKAENTGGKEM